MELKHMKLPFSLDLQFFADDGGNQADQPADNQAGGTQTQQQDQQQDQTATDGQQTSEEKTFTQEDVNNIVAKEAKKAQEKLLKKLGIDDFENAKEGLKKFKEWQDSQKTEQEKQQEMLDSLTKEKEYLSSENASLKAQLSALKQGVKAESVEDVVALAERLVDDDTSIDDAIKQVLKKYPHFASEQQEEEEDKPSFTTGQHQKKGNLDAFAKTLLGK